jgi:type VI secretion system protein ImpJ
MTYSFPSIPERIQWHEGMLLAPQHFQQSQARTDALTCWHMLIAAPLAWGIRHIEIDMGLLAGGLLRIIALDAVLPDGTWVWHDASCSDHGVLELDLTQVAGQLEVAPQDLLWRAIPWTMRFLRQFLQKCLGYALGWV